jgi:hypothetical protein
MQQFSKSITRPLLAVDPASNLPGPRALEHIASAVRTVHKELEGFYRIGWADITQRYMAWDTNWRLALCLARGDRFAARCF